MKPERNKTDEYLDKLENLGYFVLGRGWNVPKDLTPLGADVQGLLRELSQIALQEDELYVAGIVFNALKDEAGLRQVAKIGLKTNPYEAYDIFRQLNDKQGLEKCIGAFSQQHHPSENLEDAMRAYELSEKVYQGFDEFQKSRGFEARAVFKISETFNSASILAPQYDLAVPVAAGGLWAGFAFETMGLPAVICEAHAHDEDKPETFRWHDSPDLIQGARVLVLDKDCASGRTLKRVLDEAAKYSPQKVDIFFNHNAVESGLSIGTLLENVPPGYGQKYYPKLFDYKEFPKVFTKLKKRFCK